MSTSIPAQACPNCGYKMDKAADPTDNCRVPNRGDFTLCLACTALLRFGDDLLFRKTTDEDVKELDAEQLRFIERAREEHRRLKIHERLRVN